ncbi:hypothetical protein niasHT_017724 [Heterodera trifolii]|uniref:BTB domain-containing protein n=1 Tax=Heterodera trifolii TaxID=157864 RepID=A0ABD2L7C0_9BILA
MSSSSKHRNPSERMKHLLSSGEDADIQFLVGDGDKKELLSAHKLILKHASEVFEAMFRFDSQKEKTENASAVSPVEVPDVEPAAFKIMLSFIYSEDLSELNGDNAMTVLYAAKKYGIDRLVNSVLKIPISKLRSVFEAFAQTRLFDDLEHFSHQCLLYICQNASQLFKSEEFLQIDQNLLCALFDRDQLQISNEFEIWKAALRWADEKCRQNAIEYSAENRRAALGPALFKIRFPLISPAAFVKEIVPSGILTNDEFVGIYQFNFYTNFRGVPGGLYPLKFPIQTRISDWNTAKANSSRGTLAMEIEKFSEFAREKVGNERNSEMEVSINGLSWEILAKIGIDEESNEKWLEFYLRCTAPTAVEGDNWSCKCSAIFRIVSQKSGTKDLIGKANDHVFSNAISVRGFEYFVEFAELMDPCNGFYDKMEDKVSLVIDVFMEEEENEANFDLDSDPDKSNGQIVMEIDKLSEFAREIYLSERNSESIQIKGISWKIGAVIIWKQDKPDKSLGFSLECYPQKDPNWRSCECSATFRILSQKIGVDGFMEKFDKKLILSAKACRIFATFITFEELMDPSKGLYDKDGDKVTLAIDFNVEGKMGTKKRKLADA